MGCPVRHERAEPVTAVYPTPLPLDGAELLTAVWWATDPLVIAAYAFTILALTLAYVAAWGFARSVNPTPRYRRTPQASEEVESPPEVDSAPFPNLLHK